jgi:hypothetical protein
MLAVWPNDVAQMSPRAMELWIDCGPDGFCPKRCLTAKATVGAACDRPLNAYLDRVSASSRHLKYGGHRGLRLHSMHSRTAAGPCTFKRTTRKVNHDRKWTMK